MTHERFFSGLLLLALPGCAAEPDLYNDLVDRYGDETTLQRSEAAVVGSTLGDVTLLSTDQPDFPESAFSAGAYVAVSGPASFDIPLGAPGSITLHDRWSGAYSQTIEVPYPAYLPPGILPNALSVAVPGALGDIYVNQVLTGIYRVNSLFGYAEQYTVEAVPDLPPCSVDPTGDCSVSSPCANPPVPGAPACDATTGLPPLGNSLLQTEDGTLYVSDSFQASVWRVSPVTRDYELWLSSGQLEGNVFSPFPSGANGMAKGPDGKLYIANTTGGPMMGGAIYRVAMVDEPTEADIELVTAWPPFTPPGSPFPLPEGPDGLRFDADGNLWVTLAFANVVARLSMVNDQVVAEDRFGYTPPPGGIPFHQPSELHLDSSATTAFFGNHALEPATPANWALFSMETEVVGAPLEKAWVGWDCAVHDCDIDWQSLDAGHAASLVVEELFAL